LANSAFSIASGLELVGRGLAGDAVHAHAVGSDLLELDAREVGHHVGRDVRPRIAHLVDELLGHRVERYPPAGARVLGNDERSVGGRLRDRISDVRQVGDRAPVVQAVAARALRTALEDVPGDDASRQPIPILGTPAELVPQRRHGECGVGRTPRDHDVRAARECLDDRCRADVGVGREHAVAHRVQRLAGVHVAQLVAGPEQLVEPREQVVAGDDAHTHLPARAEPLGDA
jgi:hypothetical protein